MVTSTVDRDPVADSLAQSSSDPIELRVMKGWHAWLKWRILPLIIAATALLVTIDILLITNNPAGSEGIALYYNTTPIAYRMAEGGINIIYRHPDVVGDATIDSIDVQLLEKTDEITSDVVSFPGTPTGEETTFLVPTSAIPWLQGGMLVRAKMTYWLRNNTNDRLSPHTLWASASWRIP